MSKRIVISTNTPNDQGGIITNDVIDFSRFVKNPVCLKQHNWETDPIGLWTDIHKGADGWSGIPVFHGLTKESFETKELFEGGWIRGASIGGVAIWKQNAAGKPILDKNGLKTCTRFILYEISIVTIPSNEDAVQVEDNSTLLSAKIYNEHEVGIIEHTLITLSSKYNTNIMAEVKPTAAATESAPVAEPVAAAAAPVKAEQGANNDGGSIPKWLKELVGLGGRIIFGGDNTTAAGSVSTSTNTPGIQAPAPAELPASQPGTELPTQPTPIGLATKEKAKKKAEKARENAEQAVKVAEEAKKKADSPNATDKEKTDYSAAYKAAEAALDDLAAAERELEQCDKPAALSSHHSEIVTPGASMKPQLKTTDQLRADLKLAAPPTHQARVVSMGNGRTFTQLSTDKGEGRAILNRVLTSDAGEKNIADYAIVLNSIMEDSKFAALKEKVRVMMNVNEALIPTYRDNPKTRAGIGLAELASQVNSGVIDVLGKDNVMRTTTKLSSTDDALASPALNAISFLPLAIFKLFPSTSWRNDIPLFAAQETQNNTGLIWANVDANPTVYKGNQPVNVSDYTYTDKAVALKLIPYWLQPMRWSLMSMHQLRYDMMGTGWAQGFSNLAASMDDDMLYTLASTVPAGSVVKTSGDAFTISGTTDPNAFYYGSFTGSLKSPVLNDVVTIEQIYNRQNFELQSQRPLLVVDSTMDGAFSRDPKTQSLLTRWVDAEGGELTKFKNTTFTQRSRVVIYDPASGQVKDPSSVLPATAVSAALGFMPSQVGMGLGMLDVFMIQDPSTWGYKMSADIRAGISPLREDCSGTALLTYGAVS